MDNRLTGSFISQRRKELNMNQKQLAEKLNVTDKAVSKWETGRSAPDIANLMPLSEALDVTVVEILKGLKERGAGVYLVSNAQACFTKDEIDELCITELFDDILISSDAGVKKPSSEIFSVAFNKFSLSASECVYVGNDLHDDVLGASGAGLKTVYIETEQSGKYENIDITPDYIVNSHKDMMELLFSLAENKNDK